MVPIGARRITHHSSFCTICRAEPVTLRNGSAFSPTESVAMPTAIEITRICRALKLRETEPSSPADPVMPRKFEGTRPWRKSSQPPWVSEASAASAVTPELAPGEVTAPRAMPIETAIRAVIANQSSVFPASRAAPVTPRRFAIDVTIARKISGGTRASSRATEIEPMVCRVVVSQFGPSPPSSPAPGTGPIWAATRPRITPRIRPIRTCQPKGMPTIARSGLRRAGVAVGEGVEVLTSAHSTPPSSRFQQDCLAVTLVDLGGSSCVHRGAWSAGGPHCVGVRAPVSSLLRGEEGLALGRGLQHADLVARAVRHDHPAAALAVDPAMIGHLPGAVLAQPVDLLRLGALPRPHVEVDPLGGQLLVRDLEEQEGVAGPGVEDRALLVPGEVRVLGVLLVV